MNSKVRIGIFTLNGYTNYGNRLMSYATQHVLKEMGVDSDTIITVRAPEDSSLRHKLKTAFGLTMKERFLVFRQKIKRRTGNLKHKSLKVNRTERFKAFSKNYISERTIERTADNFQKLNEEYDYFITGSDQVWNPINLPRFDELFLTHSEKKKNIAFAASFGRDYLPHELRDTYKEYLDNFSQISVREDAGKTLVEDLCSREAVIISDPTLIVDVAHWRSLYKNKHEENMGYLVSYFLGEMDDETKYFIKDTAGRLGLDVKSFSDIGDEAMFTKDPIDFIQFIDHAELVVTDSFHGTVFSILMNTPFVVCKRRSQGSSMYSRLETLLKKFNMFDREFRNMATCDDVLSQDFSGTQAIINLEKKKTETFLRHAIK